MANAVWNTFGTICSILIGLFTAPVLIQHLGTAHYGIFLLIGSVTGLLTVMNFGLGEATLRYVARYYGDRDSVGINRVFGSTLSFYVVIAAVVSALLIPLAQTAVTFMNIQKDQHQLVSHLVQLATLVFAARIISSAYSGVPLALQRYDIGNKMMVGVNLLRTGGYLLLAIAGFELIHLIVWDLVLTIAAGALAVVVARRLLPTLKLLPSFSFHGLKETMSYGIFSFLTWAFHTMHRESGKMILGKLMGAAQVAYIGAPDNIAQRLHMVVATGSEALVPRFSAERDAKVTQNLYWNALWFALALSLVLFIPFFVLAPDFLRLWINPEFASQSGFVGQLLALYLISQGTFAPVAGYYRGVGKPWYVTVTIVFALIITVTVSLYLIPTHGVVGAGYAYVAGSSAPFLAVVVGGFYAFGRHSLYPSLRALGLPLLLGFVTCVAGLLIRSRFGELSWVGLFALGAVLLSLSAVLIVAGDWLLGGSQSPSKQLIERVLASRKYKAILRLIPVRSFGLML